MTTKKLRLFNGRVFENGKTVHGYIAAFTRADAVRVANAAGYNSVSPHEMSKFWSEAWGTPILSVVGEPAERCFWIERKTYFERMDKHELASKSKLLDEDELLRKACIYAEQDRQAFLEAIANCAADPEYAKRIKETEVFIKQLKAYRQRRWGKSQSDLLDESPTINVSEAVKKRNKRGT